MRWSIASVMRDLMVPGLAGYCLNAVNFHELGFRVAPDGVLAISWLYIRTGPWALVAASIVVGVVATRAWVGWAAFYLPSWAARMATGTLLFVKGQANAWPIFLVVDLILGVVSLALVWTGHWAMKAVGNGEA